MTQAIRDEICRAAELLGADGEEFRAMRPGRIYDALEDLGADTHLLAVVGSWGDTLDDTHVLEQLRRWNRGKPALDRVIATTRGKRPRA